VYLSIFISVVAFSEDSDAGCYWTPQKNAYCFETNMKIFGVFQVLTLQTFMSEAEL